MSENMLRSTIFFSAELFFDETTGSGHVDLYRNDVNEPHRTEIEAASLEEAIENFKFTGISIGGVIPGSYIVFIQGEGGIKWKE